jgi:hypothetical protein
VLTTVFVSNLTLGPIPFIVAVHPPADLLEQQSRGSAHLVHLFLAFPGCNDQMLKTPIGIAYRTAIHDGQFGLIQSITAIYLVQAHPR